MIGVLCNGQLYWTSLQVALETGSVLCRIALWDSFWKEFWQRFPPNFETANERKDSVPRQSHKAIRTQHWHSFLRNLIMDSSLRAFPGHTHRGHCSLIDLKPVSWPTWQWTWDTDIQMYLQFLFYNQSFAVPSSNGCLSNRENDQRVKWAFWQSGKYLYLNVDVVMRSCSTSGPGTRDEPLRTSAWEAKLNVDTNHMQSDSLSTSSYSFYAVI